MNMLEQKFLETYLRNLADNTYNEAQFACVHINKDEALYKLGYADALAQIYEFFRERKSMRIDTSLATKSDRLRKMIAYE